MADICPFQSVHYSRRRVRNLDKVICPPYDIISPQLQDELYRRSPNNFVRLEFPCEQPGDTAANNRYTRAAATLEQWLEQGILAVDDKPAMYVHDHHFTYQGIRYTRRGITVRVRLEEPNSAAIRPHEGTLTQPKTDRLNLLWALQANTSPIFALFEDTGRQVSALLDRRGRLALSTRSASDESHEVWAITEPGVINRICGLFSGKPLYIADGHHRYESALTYRRERLSCMPSTSPDESFNFVMMTLVDFADPGLIILPPHRLVRGLPKVALDELPDKLKAFFDVEELPLNPVAWQGLDSATDDVRIALFGLDGERLMVLTLRDSAAAASMMPYFHSEVYKRLEVSIVDHIILEKLLGLDGDKTVLNYSYDRIDAVNRVRQGEYQLAFLIKPIKVETIKAVADAGDRMPKKSTYFYPKLPAGLVLYRFV